MTSTVTNDKLNLNKQTTASTLTSQTVLNSMPQFSETLTSTVPSTSTLVYNKPMLQQPYQVKFFSQIKFIYIF